MLKDEDIVFVNVEGSEKSSAGDIKLKKFVFIKDCIQNHIGDFEYFAFIQSNARCLNKVTLTELVGEDYCDLAVCKHISAYRVPFKSLYYNKPDSTIDIGKWDTSNFTYV